MPGTWVPEASWSRAMRFSFPFWWETMLEHCCLVSVSAARSILTWWRVRGDGSVLSCLTDEGTEVQSSQPISTMQWWKLSLKVQLQGPTSVDLVIAPLAWLGRRVSKILQITILKMCQWGQFCYTVSRFFCNVSAGWGGQSGWKSRM